VKPAAWTINELSEAEQLYLLALAE